MKKYESSRFLFAGSVSEEGASHAAADKTVASDWSAEQDSSYFMAHSLRYAVCCWGKCSSNSNLFTRKLDVEAKRLCASQSGSGRCCLRDLVFRVSDLVQSYHGQCSCQMTSLVILKRIELKTLPNALAQASADA